MSSCDSMKYGVIAMSSKRTSFRLEDARGRQPIILIFAASDRSPAYENQMALLEKAPIFDKADALIGSIFAEGESYIQDEKLDPVSVEQLRLEFNVKDDEFLIVLIGQDGVEKRRDDAPLQPAVILERISDATPSE